MAAHGGIIWPVGLDPAIVPSTEFEVNWGHPLAGGLLSFYVPGLRQADFGSGPTLTNAGVDRRTTGPLGLGLTSASGFSQAGVPPAHLWGGPLPTVGITIAWLGQFTAAPAYTPTTPFCLFGVQGTSTPGTNGAATWYGDPSGFWYLNANTGGTNIYVQGPGIPTAASGPVMYIATFGIAPGADVADPSDIFVEDPSGIFIGSPTVWNASLYASGTLVASGNGASFGNISFSTSAFVFLGGISTNPAATSPNCLTYLMGVWGTPLSQGQAEWLTAEPFGLLKPQRRMLPVLSISNSGSVLAHYPGMPIDLLSGLKSQGGPPAEAKAGVAKVTRGLIETLRTQAPVLVGRLETVESQEAFGGIPIESTLNQIKESDHEPMELNAGVVRLSRAPMDWKGPVAQVSPFSLPMESVGGVAGKAGVPVDFGIGVRRLSGALAEALTGIRGQTHAQMESLGLMSLTRTLGQIEALAREAVAGRLPAETTTGLRAGRAPIETLGSDTGMADAPMDWSGSPKFAAQAGLPMEVLASPRATEQAPVETVGTPKATTSNLPLESLRQQTAAHAGLPAEALGSPLGQTHGEAETLGTWTSTERVPVESQSKAQAFSNIPLETLAAMRASLGLDHLPLESVAGIAGRALALLETVGQIRRLSEAPSESLLALAKLVETVALEVLGTQTASERVPADTIQTTFALVGQAGLPIEAVGAIAGQTAALLEEIGAASYLPPTGRIYLVLKTLPLAQAISEVGESFAEVVVIP